MQCLNTDFINSTKHSWGLPGGSVVKLSLANSGDTSSIPGSGRSPGERNGKNSLAWRIQWIEELGVLQSMGCKEPDTFTTKQQQSMWYNWKVQ